MKRIASIFALPALVVAAPAAAQMKPASSADLLEAIEACKSVTTPAWIYAGRLDEQGWHTAEVRGERRRVRKVRGIYEKVGNRAYVVLSRDDLRSKECVVQARLKDTASYTTMLQEVSGAIGMPSGQSGFAYTWDLGKISMRVEPMGERNAPSARFVMTALPMVSTDDLLTAVRACIPAIRADGFGEAEMAAEGWTKEVAADDGERAAMPVTSFQSDSAKAVVASGTDRNDKAICQVSGRLAAAETVENLRSALTGMYGTPRADNDDLKWNHDGRTIGLYTNKRGGDEGYFAIQIPVSYVGETE